VSATRFAIHRANASPLLWLLTTMLASGTLPNAWGVDSDTMHELTSRATAADRNYLEAQQRHANDANDATQARLQRAKLEYDERSLELDTARVSTLAEFSGLAPKDIEKRRMAGATWETIATDIGVHPSIIGIELIDTRPPPFDGGLPR